MNYIVLDLEWNQSSSSALEEPRMPFEIIEIGAIKLDEKLNIVDEFSSIIKPRIYRKLHYKIREMLNYDETTLRKGKPFDMVCRQFLKWCGDDYIFCTWGPLDLTELQQNMDYYYMKKLPQPLKFYNFQDIYADYTNDHNGASKLEKAVTNLNIPISKPFHTAVNDARYTAYVFIEMSSTLKNLTDMYSIDYYNHPTCKDEEIKSYHSTYTEYITREFESKQEALLDKDVSTLRCPKCKRKISKKIKWFVNSQSTSLCAGKCWTHGCVCGKLKFKLTPEGKTFVIKTEEAISKNEFESVKNRQDELRLKRKEKRKSKSSANKNKASV